MNCQTSLAVVKHSLSEQEEHDFTISFRQANSLTDLKAYGYFTINFHNIERPLENLKQIYLSGAVAGELNIGKANLMQLLQASPNLECLNLERITLEEPITVAEVLIILNLKILNTLIIGENIVEPQAISLLRRQTQFKVVLKPKRILASHTTSMPSYSIVSSSTAGDNPDPNLSYVVEADEANRISPDLRLDAREIPYFQNKPYFIRVPKAENASKNIRQCVYRFNPDDCSFDSIPQSYTAVKVKVNTTFQEKYFYYNFINYNPSILKNFQAGQRVVFYTETPNDVLLGFWVLGNIGDATFSVERGDNGLFYVTASKDLSAVDCQFLLGTPKEEELSPFPLILLELEHRISEFSEDDTNYTESNYSNEEKIKEILKRKKGACRHRVQAFIYEFYRIRAELLEKGDNSLRDYEIRMNVGSGHAWFEWRANANEPFQMRDYLGGYPVRMHYQPVESFSSELALSASISEQSHYSNSSKQHPALLYRRLKKPSPTPPASPWMNSALLINTLKQAMSPNSIQNDSCASTVSESSVISSIKKFFSYF